MIRRHACFLFVVFALLCVMLPRTDATHVSSSKPIPEPTAIELLMHAGIDDVIIQKYDIAFRCADSVAKLSKGPEAWALRALILQAWIIDYESFDRVNEFSAACDSAENRANAVKKTSPGLANLTLGLVDGFRATIAMRQEKWIKAMSASLAMKSELEDALAADSSLTDSYVGLGSFDYWSSKKLKFLPFLGDHRERGIANIRRAQMSGRIHSASAVTALIWIYIDKGEYAEALSNANQELWRYPEARSFLWAAGEAAYALRDWEKGIAYYKHILASVRSDPMQGNHLNEMGCYHRLADMSMKMGDTAMAKVYVGKAFALTLTPDIRARKKKDLTDFNKWWKEWYGATYGE